MCEGGRGCVRLVLTGLYHTSRSEDRRGWLCIEGSAFVLVVTGQKADFDLASGHIN